MLDPLVIEARSVQQRYNELNANTVKKVSHYDPALKCWTFKTVQTDENASKFTLKSLRKTKPVKVEKAVKIAAKPTQVEENKAKRAQIKDDRRTKIYQMYEAGISIPSIAKHFKLSVKSIQTEISKYRNINGIKFQRPKCKTYQDVEKILNGKEVLTISQIARKLGKNRGTISFHIERINAEKLKNN